MVDFCLFQFNSDISDSNGVNSLEQNDHHKNGDLATVASPAMGHWGTCPSRLPTISFF